MKSMTTKYLPPAKMKEEALYIALNPYPFYIPFFFPEQKILIHSQGHCQNEMLEVGSLTKEWEL